MRSTILAIFSSPKFHLLRIQIVLVVSEYGACAPWPSSAVSVYEGGFFTINDRTQIDADFTQKAAKKISQHYLLLLQYSM